MKKSLVPLIISLSFIVLLTAIIVNTRPEMRNPIVTDSVPGQPGVIKLNKIKPVEIVQPEDKVRNEEMSDEKILNMLLQAYSELDNGKISEAENKVKTVLVFQPDNGEALSLLGKIYYLKHDYKRAEMIFSRQVNLNRKSATAYNNLGQVLLKQKKYDRAALRFQVAQELDPESGLIALNLAGAYSKLGKKEEALASFRKAFRILGPRVITVASHPALDNIRDEKEFKDILKKAYAELAEKHKKAAPENKEPENKK
ncbi:MAG: tetratricopeptide repeat protein [Victivallaceae bacterium]|nr:tetratricopeptide repeat protein [Victivallaceae bacterium]